MNKATDPSAECQDGKYVVDAERADLHRRTLLKGSAAVLPMILTLRSGAALAASSANSCVEAGQGQAAAEGPAIIRNEEDTWWRIPVNSNFLSVLKRQGSSSTWVIDGTVPPVPVYQSRTTANVEVWLGLATSTASGALYTRDPEFTGLQHLTSPGSGAAASAARGHVSGPHNATVPDSGSGSPGGTTSGYYYVDNAGRKFFLSENAEPVAAYGLVVTGPDGSAAIAADGVTNQVGLIATTNGASAISESCWCSIA